MPDTTILRPGSSIGGYQVVRTEALEHLQGTFVELTHVPTGARHIHVAAPEDSKAFSVVFPTVPTDSSGVAHILEHVVLAGSERFPVRDPFFSMIPRSLKDFMNALTFPDATAYPFSTRNAKDFYNLLDVYLDAVFFPLLTETTFQQEGHRLEFEDPADPTTPLRFAGVVFNEMKGSMASPSNVMNRALGRALFPGLTYANNSGGDPASIPDLTWEQLKAFHARHYHPSNAFFYTFGDLPLEEILGRIEAGALTRFERIDPGTAIPDQRRFSEPVDLVVPYPVSAEDDASRKGQALVAWLTGYVGDCFETLALNVLAEVLLGNAASPLRKALIDSHLGDALADGTGLHDSYREMPFGAGLKGADASEAEKIEAVVLETLAQLAAHGLDERMVEAAIHQFEIRSREVSNAGFPYALRVFFQIAAPYLHGGDPFRALRFDDDLARLEQARRDPSFFPDLIRRHLLDNPHRARIVLVPDANLQEERDRAERARLDEIAAGLGDDERRAILERSAELQRLQEERGDVSVLPTLEIADIPMRVPDPAHEVRDVAGTRTALFGAVTNGLVYVDVRADLAIVPDRLVDRLPLFAYALTKMGAGTDDYLRMATRIDSYTGGIDAMATTRPTASGDPDPLRWLIVRGKALTRNLDAFASILRDLFASVRFDPERLHEVIAEFRTRMESQIVASGHQYALSLAGAQLTPNGALGERLGGLAQLAVLRDLAGLASAQLGGVVAELDEIRDLVFRAPGLDVCVSAEPDVVEDAASAVHGFASALPSQAAARTAQAPAPGGPAPVARTTSAPVAFNARVHRTVGYLHPDAAPLMVLAPYLRSTFLHREVREKGGAYGGSATCDREGGTFSMWAYRDPHIARTFAAFDQAAEHATGEPVTPEDLREAILAACSAVDPLLSGDNAGRVRHYDARAGYEPDVKAAFKERLLAVTADDLRRVAATYLTTPPALATISAPDRVREANERMGGIFEVAPV